MKHQMLISNRVKIFLILFLVFCLTPSPVNAEKVDELNVNNYVMDNANILSEETEQYIINNSKALEDEDGTQFVVVTVNDLDGKSIEDYSITLARKIGLGNEKKDNGLLLLISLEERELRIEVGNGLEGILPDGKCGRYRDQYMIPYLKNDEWDNGIKNGYDAFFKEIVTQNNLNIDYTNPIDESKNQARNPSQAIDWGVFWMLSLFWGFFFGKYIKNIKKPKKRKATITYIISTILFMLFIGIISSIGGIIASFIINLFGLFFGLFAKEGSSSGGSFGGSSGGFSGGGFSSGGGGGFSGGGGGFSGGGASGKF